MGSHNCCADSGSVMSDGSYRYPTCYCKDCGHSGCVHNPLFIFVPTKDANDTYYLCSKCMENNCDRPTT